MYKDSRRFDMSPSAEECLRLFGNIEDEAYAAVKCACQPCNSCTCACSCRVIPDVDEINW